MLDESAIRSICEILARTDGGLTNKEIDEVLARCGIEDPTPKPTPYTYVPISKRDRLFRALVERQRHDGAANAVLLFLARSFEPVRFHESAETFERRRSEINVPLAFTGFYVIEEGKVARQAKVKTLSEAHRRAMRLRSQLVERDAHPRLLSYCLDEIQDDNYFHAVLEASKSLADEIRRRTGLSEDGVRLIDKAFEPGERKAPRLALTAMTTPMERSRQRGLANSLRGVFASLRNPTAHEPRIHSTLTEQDAIDEMGHMSYLHRQLDECHGVRLNEAGIASAFWR